MDLPKIRNAAFLVVWWIGATLVLLGTAELAATGLFWVHDRMRPATVDPVMPMTTARDRVRQIAKPNVDVPGVHTDVDGWRVERAGDALFSNYSTASYNIVLFGGSTMWGDGVGDGETVVAQLRALMGSAHSRDGRVVRFYNAGQMDYALHHEVYLLVDFLRQGRRIDLAIFYDGANEECTVLPSIGDFRQQDRHYEQFLAAIDLANSEPLIYVQNLSLARLARAVRGRLWQEMPSPAAPSDGVRTPEACAQAYLRDAQFVRRLASDWNVETAFVLQPLGAFVPGAAAFPFPVNGPLQADYIGFYRSLYDRILAEAPAASLEVRNWSGLLDEPFRRGEQLFVDAVHLTGRGNAIVARKFYDLLVQDGRIVPERPGAR